MLDFISPEYFEALLSPQAKADLTEKLIVVAIVWFTMGARISARFKQLSSEVQGGIQVFNRHLIEIEKKFDQAVNEMKSMRDAIQRDLHVNSERLKHLESGVNDLRTRVQKLEQPKEG